MIKTPTAIESARTVRELEIERAVFEQARERAFDRDREFIDRKDRDLVDYNLPFTD